MIKHIIVKSCTYAPTIMNFRQPENYASKTITYIYIHQHMEHASYKKIQDMLDPGIIQVLSKCTPKLTVTFQICMISKETQLVLHSTVMT